MPLFRPQQPTIRLLRICLFLLIWYNEKMHYKYTYLSIFIIVIADIYLIIWRKSFHLRLYVYTNDDLLI